MAVGLKSQNHLSGPGAYPLLEGIELCRLYILCLVAYSFSYHEKAIDALCELT